MWATQHLDAKFPSRLPNRRKTAGQRGRPDLDPACRDGAPGPGYHLSANVVHNVCVDSGQKHSGGGLSHVRVLSLAVGVTVTVVAWGVLVFAAIDFGRSARDGQGDDWLFLLLATIGAVACMFLAILLAAKMQALIKSDPTRPHSGPSSQVTGQPRSKHAPAGGKRAAR